MKIKLISLIALFAMFTIGCNKSALPKDLLDELSQKGHQDHLAIGWVDGQKLEVVAFAAKPQLRDYVLSPEQAQEISTESQVREKPIEVAEGSDAQRSPDGKWITYRTLDNKFVLTDSLGKLKRPLFGGDKILTSVYWSPDSEYLMYVQKSGKFDVGCLRYMDDGRDIVIYRLRDGHQGRIYQTCQGYPVNRFGWLTVPPKLGD
jgi:hypothetical protein